MATLAEIIEKHGGLIQTGPFGTQLKQAEYVEDGIPVVMPKDIINGSVSIDTVARVTEQKADQLSRHKMQAGTIAFPRRGEISKCAYITEEQQGFLCGTGCLKIEAPRSVIEPRFLYYYLGLRHVVEWLQRNAVGTTMLNLNTLILGGIEFPDISLEEQREVVSVIDTYERILRNNRRRIQLLEESARLLYREWFVHLRFPGHEHVEVVDGVPEAWSQTTAYEAMDVLSGGTPKTSVDEFWGGDIPFFTPKDATDSVYVQSTEKTLTETGMKRCNSKLYPRGTLFITARGTVGKLNLAQVPMAMNQSCYALVAREPLSQTFLYCALEASIGQYKARATGAVFDAIVVDTFKRIPFVLPTKNLIQEFTETIEPAFEQIDKLLTMNRRITEARDILLPRLMNGDIAV